MSQAELEIKAGMGKGRINKYEKGITEPTVQTLISLANALDCSLTTLVTADLSLEIKEN